VGFYESAVKKVAIYVQLICYNHVQKPPRERYSRPIQTYSSLYWPPPNSPGKHRVRGRSLSLLYSFIDYNAENQTDVEDTSARPSDWFQNTEFEEGGV
jgi:hypothetical protein